jgi:hypothetical protein
MGSSFSPLLFPTLTIFLLVFHLFIACFMAMKYWCDKAVVSGCDRLCLCRFGIADGRNAVQLSGLADLYQFNVVNYNDAMIFFMFRHLLMAVFIVRQYSIHAITPFTVGAYRYCEHFLLPPAWLLAWIYSSHSPVYPLIWLIMKPGSLWFSGARHNISLIVFWVVTLVTLMFITRVRNLFWVGGNFCASAISSRSHAVSRRTC